MAERYRIWMKNGKYEVAVANNRHQAVNVACREKGVNRSEITKVGRAHSRGKLFNYPFKGRK